MSELFPCGIALGANLGNPRATLGLARRDLEARIVAWGGEDLCFSALWETEPVGPPQPRYLNAALHCLLPASVPPLDVMRFLLATEAALGRVRRERWGPRTLDLDLLFMGRMVLDTAELQLPHPRAAERGFVLRPLLDVCARAPLLPGGRDVDVALAAANAGHDGMTLVAAADAW